MAIDLSELDAFDAPPKKTDVVQPVLAPSGKPLELRLSDIDEDPNQPRVEFGETAMQEMIESVKRKGVISPISVRPHPADAGRYIINHGARRYRASLAAGRDTIRAFVDDQHDEYDQVIENLQRCDLTAIELAAFVDKRLHAGDKPVEIAKRLGKNRSFVTVISALIDPPAGIEEVYRSGRCRSPQTLYDLRNLVEKYPEHAQAMLAGDEELTRAVVARMADSIKRYNSPAPPSASADILAGDDGRTAPIDVVPAEESVEEPKKPAKESDPNKLKKPLLLVEFDGRSASVILNARPSTPGLLYIRYEDNGEVHEVDAGKCKINRLLEGKGE